MQSLAQLTTHSPNKGEQPVESLKVERMVRYYGYYSYKSRALRKKAGVDDRVPALIESEVSPKEFRQNWARLIQKIYHSNPLLCPNCLGSMRIISFIEDDQLVKKSSSIWIYGMSNANPLREPMTRHLKP